jgi:hypothetical protein
MRCFVSISAIFAFLFTIGASALSQELYPLYPKGFRGNFANPDSTLDQYFPIQHCDEFPEYYLGCGAVGDTFFVIFEPIVPCSVKYVEAQWYEEDLVQAFIAWYSDEAIDSFPTGQAPWRGSTSVSPIGEFIAPITSCSTRAEDWSILLSQEDLNGGFICWYPLTQQVRQFGVGFVKNNAIPHPLADNMNSKGIYYSYTWFGGPWMINNNYPQVWGGYTPGPGYSVVELMMRVWVAYCLPFPIIITNLSQHCNTYNTSGPYMVTCNLVDDGAGITDADSIALIYTVDGGVELAVELERVSPGGDLFRGFIPGQPVQSLINYRIFTIDDEGIINQSLPMIFRVLEPDNPDADLLFIDDDLYDRDENYWSVLHDSIGIEFEYWNIIYNHGIDASVVNWGWDKILLASWAGETIPAEDDSNGYEDFLLNGGRLALIDQDYFYANGLPSNGQFSPGDFAYDYLGIISYTNNPAIADGVYRGVAGDCITNPFFSNPYQTYWDTSGIHMEPEDFSADYFIPHMEAEAIFYGEEDDNVYGVKYDNGIFKTVFLSFMAEASCFRDNYGYWVPSLEFTTLLSNILSWFDTPSTVADLSFSISPLAFSLGCYPNPFNSSLDIRFEMTDASPVDLRICNTSGREVWSMVNGKWSTGENRVVWEAKGMPSGIYFIRWSVVGGQSSVQKVVLIK